MDPELATIVHLGLCFMLLFSAEFTTLNLQKTIISSIEDERPEFQVEGYSVHSLTYTVTCLSFWLAPSVVSLTGPTLGMSLASLGYAVYMLALSMEYTWSIYCGAVVVGVSGSVLWTAEGKYLVTSSTPQHVPRNICVFWMLFMCAMFPGNIYAYFQLEGKKYLDRGTRRTILYVLASSAGLAALLFSRLRKPSTSATPDTGPRQALAKTWALFTTRDILVLCVTFCYTVKSLPNNVSCTAALNESRQNINYRAFIFLVYGHSYFEGLQQAFISGIYGPSVGFTLQFGAQSKQLVPLSGIFAGLGNFLGFITQKNLFSATTNLIQLMVEDRPYYDTLNKDWGRFQWLSLPGGASQYLFSERIRRIRHSRSLFILLSLVLEGSAYCIIFLNLPDYAVFGNTYNHALIHSSKGLAVLSSFLLGVGDSLLNTQNFSILAVLHPESSSQTTALYMLSKAMCVAVSFFCSSRLGLHSLLLTLLTSAVLSSVAFTVIDRKVVRLQAKHTDNVDLSLNS